MKQDEKPLSSHAPEHGFGIQLGSTGNTYTCLKCGETFNVTEGYLSKIFEIYPLLDKEKILKRFGIIPVTKYAILKF